MATRSGNKSQKDSGSSAMDVLPDGAGVKVTIFSAPKNFTSLSNGDLAMAQDTGQRAAEMVIFPEDELSIDDLDGIVGGFDWPRLGLHRSHQLDSIMPRARHGAFTKSYTSRRFYAWGFFRIFQRTGDRA